MGDCQRRRVRARPTACGFHAYKLIPTLAAEECVEGPLTPVDFSSSRRRHTRFDCDWSSDVCSSDLWNDLPYSCPGIFGVKTGHTSAAGWSEVAAARRRGVSIYAALLGSPDRSTRNADLAELLDWGLSRYVTVKAAEPGQVYAEAELGYGRHLLALVAARPLVATVRVDRPLVRRVVSMDAADLPVSRGQSLGQVRIYQRGRLVGAVPLVAARPGAQPRGARRVGWYAGRTPHHMAGWVS